MLNYHKVDFSLKTDASFIIPYFTGSMLRGAFGVSLKNVVCINPSRDCTGCFAAQNCLYHEFYEEKNGFHRYRFDITLGKKELDFSFFLFDKATEKLPYVLSAFVQMAQKTGLGVDRRLAEIKDIRIDNKSVYQGGMFVLKDTAPVLFEQEEKAAFATEIKFLTPLRIKQDNKFLKTAPSIESLLKSILFRYSQITGEKTVLDYRPVYTVKKSDIKFEELTRYSNRQKTKMQLGGVTGNMRLEKIDGKTMKILKLGEMIGAGKQTVFGLGKIKIEEV